MLQLRWEPQKPPCAGSEPRGTDLTAVFDFTVGKQETPLLWALPCVHTVCLLLYLPRTTLWHRNFCPTNLVRCLEMSKILHEADFEVWGSRLLFFFLHSRGQHERRYVMWDRHEPSSSWLTLSWVWLTPPNLRVERDPSHNALVSRSWCANQSQKVMIHWKVNRLQNPKLLNRIYTFTAVFKCSLMESQNVSMLTSTSWGLKKKKEEIPQFWNKKKVTWDAQLIFPQTTNHLYLHQISSKAFLYCVAM